MTPITADSLRGVTHGFFTREGGVSAGLYAGLNGGPGSGDDPASVAENRRRIAERLGAAHLVSLHQVHSAQVASVTGPWPGERPRADAMVTDRPGLALGVLTADCAPVLFADAEAGVVGAAHAGWKGALAGVLEATVAAMAALGAEPARIVAAVGPAISQRAYEVGPEFLERFVTCDPDYRRHFDERAARPRFDLRGFIGARLLAAGVGQIELLDHDTCAEDELFFSFRRSTLRREERFGLQLSGIVLDG